ncbi:MAG: hypothetical protein ACE5F6_10365 [Anaerolineae bacterium]
MDRSERLLAEMGEILDRIGQMLRILDEEIVVFDYVNEKYRQEDPDIESF